MATAPGFASTVLVGSAIASATATTTLSGAVPDTATIVTAGASGARIDVIRCLAIGTTVAGRLNIFRQAGGSGSFFLIDQYLVAASTPGTSPDLSWNLVTNYDSASNNMLLLGASDVLAFTVMEAGNESLIMVTAIGGSF